MNLEQFLDARHFGPFIDGRFQNEGEGAVVDFASPVLRKGWKKLRTAAPKDAQSAISAASKAFQDWSATPSPERGAALRKIGEAMLDSCHLLAKVMAMEMGKTIKDGLSEVDYATGYYLWYAAEAERIYGKLIPSQYANKSLMLKLEPVGVCGIITPWNFPQAMAARKIAAALAAGCTVVCKPAQESPFSLLLLAMICSSIGLPPGVLNVVPGPEKEIGAVLLQSPQIRKISFTGSTEVGKYLYSHSAGTLKKLTMELGGHAPFLVFGDADLRKSVEGLIKAKFRNNGQTCIAANRILVQRPIYDKFLEMLVDAVGKLKIGSPLDPEADISDVLHPASLRKVEAHRQDAIQKGAALIYGGNMPHAPAILSGITSEMAIWSEETFGPLIGMRPFDSFEEGIALANDTVYGLAAYAFTESLSQAQKLINGLEYGIIGINDGLPSTPQASFGGVKQSGFGREGGPNGLKEYLVEKYISMQFYTEAY